MRDDTKNGFVSRLFGRQQTLNTALIMKKAADCMSLYRGVTYVKFFFIFSYQVEGMDRSATPTSLLNYKPLADRRSENHPSSQSHTGENLRVSIISFF